MSYPGPPAPSRLHRMVRPALAAAVDLIYPRLCCGCKVPLEPGASATGVPTWFCPACEKDLPWVEAPYCRVCGEAYDGAVSGEFRCMNCSGRRLEFEFAIASCQAEETVRELVHQFKYERRLQLRGALATLLLRTLEEPRLEKETLADWLLVPVPLHREREKEREFNQSWELCQRLSHLTGIPAAKVLARTRETDSQASLDRGAPAEPAWRILIAQDLALAGKIALLGRSILLVDDVFTTGATTNECARVLRREGGAQKVVVITVARG